MKTGNTFNLFVLILLALHACNGTSQEDPPISENSQEVFILDDFESPSISEIWNGTISLSKEFPAHGKRCLELNSSDEQSLWLESEELLKDWSSYEILKFDIYNPSS